LVGCGTAVVAGKEVGLVGISLAFGFALIAMAYGIGPISGCHINPAVSLGVCIAGRMKRKDLAGYIVGQVLGATVAALVLYLLVSGRLGADNLGQNGYNLESPGGYGLGAGMLFEFVATFLFVVTILGATQSKAPTQIAGLAIGIALVAIHLFGIPITGVSVNPARSLGPALFVGGTAIKQVWMFLLVPSVAGVIAGLLFRCKALEE
jgi:aquaporin Z